MAKKQEPKPRKWFVLTIDKAEDPRNPLHKFVEELWGEERFEAYFGFVPPNIFTKSEMRLETAYYIHQVTEI